MFLGSTLPYLLSWTMYKVNDLLLTLQQEYITVASISGKLAALHVELGWPCHQWLCCFLAACCARRAIPSLQKVRLL